MDNHEAIQYLYDLNSLGWKLGLNKIRALLREIGNPHQKFKVVHITGTNGKGSTCAILESILHSAGCTTGLYTSPHLISVCERIKCNQVPIALDDLVYYVTHLRPLIDKYKCTFFEALTTIAFSYFADRNIDIAVIEVGLGGRLDATNVVDPVLTIITDVELDHTQLLGNSRKKIAIEKGGIIKQGITCLTMSKHTTVIDTLKGICEQKKSHLIEVANQYTIGNSSHNGKFESFDLNLNGTVYPRLKLSLIGEHQHKNATLAIASVEHLRNAGYNIKIDDIYKGLMEVKWPGRMQLIDQSPTFIVDVAHNPNGIRTLIKTISNYYTYENLNILVGIVKTKDYSSMMKLLSQIATHIVVVKSESERAMETAPLAKVARQYNKNVLEFQTVPEGLKYLRSISKQGDLLIGTGSHYTVGEILKYNKKT
ncbi:bifunctional folylpolyglutamate synthase/dihydrofolate synthase [candidate division KSB1 bacterium]|nr:bifunctional folylpolyglutamate synthase/dihydrofolate synthase [candidate division KSB1 bacterium]